MRLLPRVGDRERHCSRDAEFLTSRVKPPYKYRDIHLPRVFTAWRHVLLDLVTVRRGEAVLDVATGPGSVARLAAAVAGGLVGRTRA
jgi:hypothetical protein